MKSDTPTPPYYIFEAMRRLKYRYDELSPDTASMLKQQVALNAADPAAAALYVDLGGDDWLNIYPAGEERPHMSTEEAIDTFLNVYGSKNTAAETSLLERLIFNPMPDYATVLAHEGPAPETPTDRQDAMMASFISAHTPGPSAEDKPISGQKSAEEDRPAQEVTPQPEDNPMRDEKTAKEDRHTQGRSAGGSLSESLARIFIKQGRYRQAYDIICELNLNYPEKSVYFADQMRFLEKILRLEAARAARSDSDAAQK